MATSSFVYLRRSAVQTNDTAWTVVGLALMLKGTPVEGCLLISVLFRWSDMDGRHTVCGSYATSNNRKKRGKCVLCSGWLGLTQAQASIITRWECVTCCGRGTIGDPQEQPNQPGNVEKYVGRCRSRLRVLNKIPLGALVSVAGALRRLLQEALVQKTQLAWAKLKSFCYWELQCPDVVREARQVCFATKIKQQVAHFLETESYQRHLNPMCLSLLTDS